MSQKVQIYKNKNSKSKSFGKYFVRAVYDKKFIETDSLADYIQAQASVKRSDCLAVLDELGSAMKHFFELGQKVRLEHRHLQGGLQQQPERHPGGLHGGQREEQSRAVQP